MSKHRDAWIAGALIAGGMISALSGCGGQGNPGSTGPPANIPGRDFTVDDEFKNTEKLKDAIPKR